MFIAMRKEKPSKYMDKIADYTIKCKCGHSVIFPNKEDRIVCGWCGHYVYKNDKARFKYKLKEEINKNMRYKLREDKQDEFIKNYEYQSYNYANRDDCYYLKISKHLILDQDTLEILAPTNKLEEEDIDIIAKLEANNMLEFYKEEK